MDLKNIGTVRLLEGGAYNVNIRHLVAAESALIHAKTTEVWLVTDGSGTLGTGGELVDPQKTSWGDMSSSSIRGAVSRTIKAGDIIFIPAGVPHGVLAVQGKITFMNNRFDSK